MAAEHSDQSSTARAAEITPELVRMVTEEVYRLWLAELRIERERLGSHTLPRDSAKDNGRY